MQRLTISVEAASAAMKTVFFMVISSLLDDQDRCGFKPALVLFEA